MSDEHSSTILETQATLSIGDIRIRKRHRRDMGDLRGLAASIKAEGLLQPIGVTADNELVFGERRLRACRDVLGWTEIAARVVNVSSIVVGEHAENECREDFKPSERVAIERSVNKMIERRQGERSDLSQNIGTSDRQKVANESARLSGFGSRETARQAAAVVEAAEAEPERFGKLVEDMDRSGRVNGVYKRLVIERKAEGIRREKPPLPGRGPYRVITADPPWPYGLRKTDPSHRATTPYPQMSIDQICALNVSAIAAPDCVLWLWTTNAHMLNAFAVLDAWGFQHKTILTWAKHKMGMGSWLRGQTEHCLMAVRGRPVVALGGQTTLLTAPAREHSRKPDAFYELVEGLCPGSRAELFQRHARPGWDGHGDEAVEHAA